MFLKIHTIVCMIILNWFSGTEGYSFKKFSGPVSGEVHTVDVPSHANIYDPQSIHSRNTQSNSQDFIARPDYNYAYGVEDARTGNTQSHQESRDGNAVKGEYSVVQPDGIVRTVRYTADAENGFQATVHYSGKSDRYDD